TCTTKCATGIDIDLPRQGAVQGKASVIDVHFTCKGAVASQIEITFTGLGKGAAAAQAAAEGAVLVLLDHQISGAAERQCAAIAAQTRNLLRPVTEIESPVVNFEVGFCIQLRRKPDQPAFNLCGAGVAIVAGQQQSSVPPLDQPA